MIYNQEKTLGQLEIQQPVLRMVARQHTYKVLNMQLPSQSNEITATD